jgi:hypothetical protein
MQVALLHCGLCDSHPPAGLTCFACCCCLLCAGHAAQVALLQHSGQFDSFPPTGLILCLPSAAVCWPLCRAAQVALLKELRPEKLAGSLEISTVDGFQGREKEAIVISMVRR